MGPKFDKIRPQSAISPRSRFRTENHKESKHFPPSRLWKIVEILARVIKSALFAFYLLRDHRKTKQTFWAPKLVPKWSQNDHGGGLKQGLENTLTLGSKLFQKGIPKMVSKRPGRVPKRALGELWALLGGPRAPKEPQESEKLLRRTLHGTKMVPKWSKTAPKIRLKPRRRPRAPCSWNQRSFQSLPTFGERPVIRRRRSR